jgi:AcrR family transcriptional regulator
MGYNKLNTESRILEAAINTFLLFGYHGTTLQLIANNAGVNKATIHYYFRSKERLYLNVVENIFGIFLKNGSPILANSKRFEESRWFFFTELYNNKELFEKTIKELYPNNWVENLNDIKKWLEISSIHISQLLDTQNGKD